MTSVLRTRPLDPPWAHQQEAFDRSKDLEAFAFLFEQRCGKTRPFIMTAEYLFGKKKIDSAVVLAPSGVHSNWVREEWPKWAVLPYKSLEWDVGRVETRAFKAEIVNFLTYKGLAFLSINIEALLSEKTRIFLKKFLTSRRAIVGVDESDVIKTPTAKRTRVALSIRHYAPYRRILTGTPFSEGPFDAFSQFKFLDEKILGFENFTPFKAHFAEFEVGEDRAHKEARERGEARALASGSSPEQAKALGEAYARRVGKTWPQLKAYRNVEELQARIAPYSMRVTRSEVSDAPPKVYAKRYFKLDDTQRSAYEELREKFIVELSEGVITAANVLARYTRLQQISSNIAVYDGTTDYCPDCLGAGGECVRCDGLGIIAIPPPPGAKVSARNPRLEALVEEVERSPGDSIVWAKFDRDVDDVLGALRDLGRRPVRYDGKVSVEERARNKEAFMSGDASDFVGKTSSGGRGLPLHRAENMWFYTNSFPLRLREQGEDRGEALFKSFGTCVTDILALDTIDNRILDALRTKKSLADTITGDNPREWI